MELKECVKEREREKTEVEGKRERREKENERKKREFPKVWEEFVTPRFSWAKNRNLPFLKEGWIYILRDLL